MAVRIRMKQMGRTHRHFYRIVAIDHRQPRDGKVIEDLGTYDPFVIDKDKRVTLIPDRIKYWKSVGAQVSDRVDTFLNKYMARFEAEAAANQAPPANPNQA
ncbi:30S ribosomal protein S16 [Telmatocola sphagniphila]|nr:30S ribosomal protein S16 [Telmatocola sphagniphila]